MSHDDLQETDPFQRFVLLSILELRSREESPVHSYDVTTVCTELLEEHDLEEFLAGGVTRQRVISSLKSLEDAGVLDADTKRSPTGKGRPAYTLSVEETTVLEYLEDDEQFGAAVELVAE